MHRRGDEPALPDDEEAVRRKRGVEERHVCVRARVWREQNGRLFFAGNACSHGPPIRYGIGIT